MSKQRILLVDDHTLVRAGIRSLIEQFDDFEVSAEATSVMQALDLTKGDRPDIVVTDLGMGKENGLNLVNALRERYPSLPVLVLSMHTSEAYVSNAIRVGARGYVAKDSAPAELEQALRCVQQGECYVSPRLTGKMVHWSLRNSGNDCTVLTVRQRQILALIGAGKSTKQIGFELGLSEKTVAAHRAQIGERLGIRDRVRLALFALEQGLVAPD